MLLRCSMSCTSVNQYLFAHHSSPHPPSIWDIIHYRDLYTPVAYICHRVFCIFLHFVIGSKMLCLPLPLPLYKEKWTRQPVQSYTAGASRSVHSNTCKPRVLSTWEKANLFLIIYHKAVWPGSASPISPGEGPVIVSLCFCYHQETANINHLFFESAEILTSSAGLITVEDYYRAVV